MHNPAGLVRILGVVAVAAALAVLASGGAVASSGRTTGATLSGAGSTFVAPLVAQWTPAVAAAFGTDVRYNPIGSGAGISAITGRSVDFGASDAPLSPAQFAACNGCVQIPWALSATSVPYNLPGVKNLLHMDGPTLAKIYQGQITRWNDPAIQKLNPGVALPGTAITVAHRSDDSGTTYNFTDYLSSVSPEWNQKYGTGVNVTWPVGVPGRGSGGMVSIITSTEGAVGYVDAAYSLANHLKYFAMRNRSGAFTAPGLKGILAAASSDFHPTTDNVFSIVNPPAAFKLAYPISTYTYVIVPVKTPKASDLRQFIFWAVTKGQTYGPPLLFAPIPRSALVVAEKAIAQIKS
ncbi:MAG TPA: phosphate ABC transporter substrate-binding protein PstS [Gaiellaceae bacterium]|nr:phosphate ABC transporter substrate-binding protein PstS [Gaiellaceae bacterium]